MKTTLISKNQRTAFLTHPRALALRVLGLALLAAQVAIAPAALFTDDTVIPVGDTTYDGQDVVVGNCTVTVDGPHTFANVLVTAGGMLTHSAAPSGAITNLLAVTDEPHTLTGTNPVTLQHPNVLSGTIRVTNPGKTVTYTNEQDYGVSSLGGGWTGLQRSADSTIPDGGEVLVSYDAQEVVSSTGLNLTVVGHVGVAAGGAIRADARGYGGNLGAGNGGEAGSPTSGGGAGHGGYGGLSSSNAAGGISYGMMENPATLGSGGGAGSTGVGGAGGGAIKLTAGGTVTINGVVSANGANGVNSRSGGGAGGSIWITAENIAGTGSVSVNGGNGEPIHGGGGGGGRIALHFTTNTFTGQLQAHGGTGFQAGGAGTVFTKLKTETQGTLVVDNHGASGAMTLVAGASTTSNLQVKGGAVLATPGMSVARLVVGSNSWLSLPPNVMNLNLTVTDDAVFETGGGINAVGRGFGYSQAPGSGGFYSSGANSAGGGGGHAGYGGMGIRTNLSRGGNYYGSVTQPRDPGSGGGGNSTYPGGAGGGHVRLVVGGRLHLDGGILADGERPVSNLAGGGSGGSVWLTVGELAGNGSVSANGGSAYPPNGGGGSGGRIAVDFNTNSFTGTMTAFGGTGFQNGAAGTIFTKTNSASIGQVVVDNGGIRGTNTFVLSAGNVDLAIQGGALADGVSSFRHLTIGSNSQLAISKLGQLLTVSGDARIEPGGVISMDGLGYPYNQGPGPGRYYSSGYPYSSSGGGGGHGGYGGNGPFGGINSAGGNAYDNLSNPTVPGSGGGGSPAYPGGSGGGYVQLNVSGLLHLDGRISADGTAASAGGAGGGSGGSLRLTLNRWTGNGVLSANGSAGDLPNGGGGGGGRIAVTWTSNAFTGVVTARGGAGFVAGGAGTVYLKPNNDSYPQVILDNGGVRGTNTLLGGSSSMDLIVRNGAVSSTSGGYYLMALRNLFVGSNSWFNPGYSSSETWIVLSNATVEVGGGISADGRGGYSSTGGGRHYSSDVNSSGGGGGHGGWGGHGAVGLSSAAGGSAHGPSVTAPTSLGGRGGNSSTVTNESFGGGALKLTVNGLLKLDGSISANGLPGLTGGSGGGAGGSLWLTVSRLSGTGSISANGGAGDLPNGGGGGGGRIAITWTSNSFSGSISARGGSGFVAGGAGTIYVAGPPRGPFTQLLVDNGGLRGTNTLVYPYSPTGDLIVQGGAVVVPSASLTVPNLSVFPNSAIVLSNQVLTVSGDATIHPGASILADGTGYTPGVGTGAGNHSYSPKGGGSHGGLGGANSSAFASGTVTGPATWGSGGANGSGQSEVAPLGGSGGGAVRMNVTGALTVDGRISADGTSGGLNSGGGAGGSVWLTAGTLAGTGTISANGGAGNGTAGGGGGGRVAILFLTNSLAGSVTAFGGVGSVGGGAGTVFWDQAQTYVYAEPVTVPGGEGPEVSGTDTVYWMQAGKTNKSLVVDNGGLFGTNTPLFGLPPGLSLTVARGAVVHPQVAFPSFNSLDIGPGGRITSLANQPKLELFTPGNLNIEPGGALTVDGKGFAANTGNGKGAWTAYQGGGGGHGGAGGAAASGALGGLTYGSPAQPVDRGSGGGALPPNGSEGGGAIRLSVGGTLNVGGLLSANGNFGWLDDAGGGAGGSIWATAGALTGGGQITARGGDGEWFNGGGGGGGRIALYAPANTHTGLVSVAGGWGANPGQDGTVFVSTNHLGFQITSHTPSGVVSNTVSFVNLTFNEVVDTLSVNTEDFVLITPAGPLPQENLSVSASGLFSVRVSFPVQNRLGDYRLEAGPGIANIFTQPMAGVYSGAFTIALPAISGTVTDTNGQPVAGVVVQPGDGLQSATTDEFGHYALGVPPGWNGSVAPALGSFVFVPGARTYTNVTATSANQNFLMLDSIAPQLDSGASGTNLWLRWTGIPGVTYQVWNSTNLTDWLPWSEVMPGTNGLMEMVLPADDPPVRFFRLKAAN